MNSEDEMTVMQYKGGQFIYVALRCLGSPVLPHVTVSPYEHSVCPLCKIWYLTCGCPHSIEQNLNSHKIKRHLHCPYA